MSERYMLGHGNNLLWDSFSLLCLNKQSMKLFRLFIEQIEIENIRTGELGSENCLLE